jgi:hypothetical protein
MWFAARLIIAFAVALPGIVSADELTPEKQADIRQLIGIAGAKLPAQLAHATAQSTARFLRDARPGIPERFYAVLGRELIALFEERMEAPGGLVERLTSVYATHFTHPEVKQLLAFYQTPVGRKSMEILPLLVNESTAWGQALAPEIQKRLRAALKKEGISIPRAGTKQ